MRSCSCTRIDFPFSPSLFLLCFSASLLLLLLFILPHHQTHTHTHTHTSPLDGYTTDVRRRATRGPRADEDQSPPNETAYIPSPLIPLVPFALQSPPPHLPPPFSRPALLPPPITSCHPILHFNFPFPIPHCLSHSIFPACFSFPFLPLLPLLPPSRSRSRSRNRRRSRGWGTGGALFSVRGVPYVRTTGVVTFVSRYTVYVP